MISEKLSEDIQAKIKEIHAVSNDIPGVIIIHNLRNHHVEYMSERGLKILNTTLEELKGMGTDYLLKYFNPEDAKHYTPKFLAMLEKSDVNEVISYFQQVRSGEQEEWNWFISATKVLMLDDDGHPLFCITNSYPVSELKSVTYKIERLLEERKFVHKNLKKFALLTKREKEIISLIVTGASSSTIAEKLFIAHSTVEQHRKNIKHKLKMKNMPELVLFAQAFDLVHSD